MKKLICPAVLLGCMLLVSLAPASAQAEGEIGIDRSNLTRQSEAVQEKTLRDIHALGATWFRDGFSTATPDAIAKFVNEVKLAKQNHLKFLAIVSPTGIDYDPGYHTVNASEAFTKACGWGGGSPQISKINLSKLAQRLRTQLDAVKAANLSIDAFEIGNEYDWICFNGDVPNGHAATEEDWMTAVRGYAHFLKTTATIIHDPQYFPQARIITSSPSASPTVVIGGIGRRITSQTLHVWWRCCGTSMDSITWITPAIISTATARIFTHGT